MKTNLVFRYHPTLHWLLAVLIAAMLCVGFLSCLRRCPTSIAGRSAFC